MAKTVELALALIDKMEAQRLLKGFQILTLM